MFLLWEIYLKYVYNIKLLLEPVPNDIVNFEMSFIC